MNPLPKWPVSWAATASTCWNCGTASKDIKFREAGYVGTIAQRQGKAATLLLANKRFLNSEDNSTQPATEIAADVCILDPQSQVAVLRGDVVPEGKYAGRRVFNAGINLTHLYHGKIPFLWFPIRDLGFVNKMLRGLAKPEAPPDEVAGDSIEKLWISAVETFAIGFSDLASESAATSACIALRSYGYTMAAVTQIGRPVARVTTGSDDRVEQLADGAARRQRVRLAGEQLPRIC